MRIKTAAIGQVNVEPSIVVVVEEGQAAALGLDDDSLLVDAAPNVGNLQTGLLRHVNELNREKAGGIVTAAFT